LYNQTCNDAITNNITLQDITHVGYLFSQIKKSFQKPTKTNKNQPKQTTIMTKSDISLKDNIHSTKLSFTMSNIKPCKRASIQTNKDTTQGPMKKGRPSNKKKDFVTQPSESAEPIHHQLLFEHDQTPWKDTIKLPVTDFNQDLLMATTKSIPRGHKEMPAKTPAKKASWKIEKNDSSVHLKNKDVTLTVSSVDNSTSNKSVVIHIHLNP